MNDQELHEAFYARRDESKRLESEPRGVLEKLRTQQVLGDVLPAAGIVYDVGGGAGVHAEWLAGKGYEVSLFDVVPKHVDQALAAADLLPADNSFDVALADARSIPRANDSADAVLLLGPLYHLHHQADREKSLAEAFRVLKPGGVIVAAGISRYSWLMDAYRQQAADGTETQASIAHSLETGCSNPNPGPGSFWAYFHRPEDLQAEVQTVGFSRSRCIALEGFAWMLPHLAAILESDERSSDLMEHLSAIESEASIVGASAHFVVVGQKPPQTEACS